MKHGISILAALALTAFVPITLYATPGALNAKSCHSNHCHARGEARTMSNGRHYIPGNFTHHKKKKKKK